MGFDVRLALGSFFVLIGALLALYGALTPHTLYAVSLGVDVNLGWGLVLLLFGVAMLLIAWSSRRRARQRAASCHAPD